MPYMTSHNTVSDEEYAEAYQSWQNDIKKASEYKAVKPVDHFQAFRTAKVGYYVKGYEHLGKLVAIKGPEDYVKPEPKKGNAIGQQLENFIKWLEYHNFKDDGIDGKSITYYNEERDIAVWISEHGRIFVDFQETGSTCECKTAREAGNNIKEYLSYWDN